MALICLHFIYAHPFTMGWFYWVIYNEQNVFSQINVTLQFQGMAVFSFVRGRFFLHYVNSFKSVFTEV